MIGDVTTSLFRRPATELYPFERREAPERLRGLLAWDRTNCTGCGLCAKDCPALAIQMHVIDKAAKRFVMSYQVDQCTFCAQCVHSCNKGCLSMTGEYELAGISRPAFRLYFGDPADVEIVRSGQPLGEEIECDEEGNPAQ